MKSRWHKISAVQRMVKYFPDKVFKFCLDFLHYVQWCIVVLKDYTFSEESKWFPLYSRSQLVQNYSIPVHINHYSTFQNLPKWCLRDPGKLLPLLSSFSCFSLPSLYLVKQRVSIHRIDIWFQAWTKQSMFHHQWISTTESSIFQNSNAEEAFERLTPVFLNVP